MSTSTNLILPYLASGQAQKHVTVNESLRRLDAIVQLCVVSATTTAQPAEADDGEVYILPAGKSGDDWAGMAEAALAYYRDGAWEQITPREGWIAFVRDIGAAVFFDGAAWSALAPSGETGAFTPTLSFQTPGDLAVAYSSQEGVYSRVGALVFFALNVAASSFTYTTASGNLRVNGLPFACGAVTSPVAMELFTPITLPGGRTFVNASVLAGANNLRVLATGSGASSQQLGVSDIPSGANLSMRIAGCYMT